MSGISDYIRINRAYEAKWFPRVQRAIKSKVDITIAKLKEQGIEATKRYLNEDLGNFQLRATVEKLYDDVGMRHARRSQIQLAQQVRKGFGNSEIWRRFIQAYLREFLISKITFVVATTTRDELLKVLNEGIEKGWGVDEIVKHLETFPFTKMQSARIVRTEVNRAANVGVEAQGTSFEYELQKKWISVQDNRTRGVNPKDHADHIHMNGQTVDFDDVFRDPRSGVELRHPGDPDAAPGDTINCFPGDTLVEGQFVGAQRLKYSGKLIEIITRSGKRLSITPNHPIFTNRGTVFAKDLTHFDYVISNIKKGQRYLPLRDDYIKKEPTVSANIFRTIDNMFLSEKVVSVGLDFNSDSKSGDGYIDIIDMNGELQLGDDCLIEDIGKFSLKPTSLERILVGRFCSQFSLSNANVPANGCGVSSSDLVLPFGKRHLRPFQFFSIGSSTNWNASRYEPSFNGFSADANFIRKLFHGNAGNILFDNIVKIREYYFFGHVYDFSTLSGAILANGIHISNCRCNQTLIGKRDERGRLIPKQAALAA